MKLFLLLFDGSSAEHFYETGPHPTMLTMWSMMANHALVQADFQVPWLDEVGPTREMAN